MGIRLIPATDVFPEASRWGRWKEPGGESDAAGNVEGITVNDDRMQILKMVQEGTITAEEAAKLLSALDSSAKDQGGPPRDGKARWIRVRVTDLQTGKRKVNVNIPIALAEVGARMGMRFGAKGGTDMGDFNLTEIMNMVRDGAQGKMVDVEDLEDNEHVEVYVD
jgi:hypothetical protein